MRGGGELFSKKHQHISQLPSRNESKENPCSIKMSSTFGIHEHHNYCEQVQQVDETKLVLVKRFKIGFRTEILPKSSVLKQENIKGRIC